MGWLILLLPMSPIIETHVEVTELNVVCNERWEPTLEQWVWWDQDLVVIAWRMRKNGFFLRKNDLIIFDEDVIRRIKSKSVIRSRSLDDPEIQDRKRVPMEERQGLGEWR